MLIGLADDRHCSLRLINVDGLKSYRHGVVYLREGESFHIICQMTGLKGESPRWAKNGQLKCDAAGADCTETSTSQTGQKKLVIRAANANTEANYTCEVGKAGSASFCGTESVTIYVASECANL